MVNIDKLILASHVHPEWSGLLREALASVDADYLAALMDSQNWLPGRDLLLNAFRRDCENVRYILIGESPYPRSASANGIAFYDAAVTDLWADTGLSKAVNKATSMRHIIKAALVAEGYLTPDDEGKVGQQSIAMIDKSRLVKTMPELFKNLSAAGFLMLNATPVLHPERKPSIEAKFWYEFLRCLLTQLAAVKNHSLTLVLWGKVAKTIESMDLSKHYQIRLSEHPYNVSFIHNLTMQNLLSDIAVLTKK